jgi:hypothetical protein
MRIKTRTYCDVRQKPCQFHWHGLLHFTIDEETRVADRPIGKTGWFEFRNGIPVTTNGRNIAVKPLDEVFYSNTDASFITRFLRYKYNDSSGELKSIINQMTMAKTTVDSRYRELSIDDRKVILRRELTRLFGLADRR